MSYNLNINYLSLNHRPPPDWMRIYLDWGTRFTEKVYELDPNERLTIICVLPIRDFAALFMALGIIGVTLARRQAGSMQYPELKCAWTSGKTMQYLEKNHWSDINIDDLNENKIKFSYAAAKKGNTTREINIPSSKLRLKLSSKSTNKSNIPRILTPPFIDKFWGIDNARSIDIQDLNACTLIGNKKRLKKEQNLEFTTVKSEQDTIFLSDLILCDRACSFCNYSTIEKKQGQEICIYDGSKYYRKQESSVFHKQNKIVVLSRKDRRFDDAINKMWQDDLKKGVLMIDPGFPVLPGCEIIIWKRKVSV